MTRTPNIPRDWSPGGKRGGHGVQGLREGYKVSQGLLVLFLPRMSVDQQTSDEPSARASEAGTRRGVAKAWRGWVP
jgi:hypothetical protein